MPTVKLHANEIETSVAMVRKLLREQFPQWTNLSIAPVSSTGTVNAMYRLGEHMVVRLPRVDWATDGMDRELAWLPWLASRLPVAVPRLLGTGHPTEGFPWRWCVYRWLEGETPEVGRLSSPQGLAADFAAFILALQNLDPLAGPSSDQSLKPQDAPVRDAIDVLREQIDVALVTEIWESVLSVPDWEGPPVWLHGDMSPGNMLALDGRLSAVIDFSAVGLGDPAGDLRVAWNVLPGEARGGFRHAIGADDATWARARGHALAQALMHLRYYREKNPTLAANARCVIHEIVADPG